VIALLSTRDPAYVREAAWRGIFAYILDTTLVDGRAQLLQIVEHLPGRVAALATRAL
jgi:hypothetical protein